MNEFASYYQEAQRSANYQKYELALLGQIREQGMAEPQREYRFHHERKWRFDFAYPDKLLAIEVEGGTWSGGRHTRGSGFEKDCEKYNAAALRGWRVLRFTPKMILTLQAIETIKKGLQ